MLFKRSPLLLLGFIVSLTACASSEIGRSSSEIESTVTVSEPFNELLADTSANPPLLIPELSSTSTAGATVPNSNSSSGQGLPSVSVAASDAPLLVPVPPAPATLETVPIPNPERSVVTTPEQPASEQPNRAVATSPQPVPASNVSPVVPSPQRQQPQATVIQPRPSVAAPPTRFADSVQVMGVVQVGNSVSAIVQLPDGQGSRYVQAGDALANGILVSRIEMTDDAPRVIFVQDGVEIVRTVGIR